MATIKKMDMIDEFSIDELLEKGVIANELELENAALVERQLRTMAKEFPEAQIKRSRIRELIIAYESKHWSKRDNITEARITESDKAEEEVQSKLEFIELRKNLIKSKLKNLELNQQEFGKILGHESKSYMSELMNGIVPFTLKDLVVISKLLKIDLDRLVPAQISEEDKTNIEKSIKKLGKPQLRLNRKDFAFA